MDVVRLPGLTSYRSLWEEQQALAAARWRNEIDDLLLLLEHDHVYTNGRRGKPEHLLVGEEALAALGASYVEVDRGGDITYHGPGQLVGYAIVDLAHAGLGVRAYVRALEEVLVRTAASFKVRATTITGVPGIWIGDAKLGAIGVKVSRSVTYHGFSLNVDPDLSYFSRIVPCGLLDRHVTSLAQQLGHPVAIDDVVPVCAQAFAEVFSVELCWRESIPTLHHARRSSGGIMRTSPNERPHPDPLPCAGEGVLTSR
jgi:lipoyl(octanoyl) transferase